MSKRINHDALSKTISHALRHKPEAYGIELNSEGWVSLEKLYEAIKQQVLSSGQLEIEDILEMIASAKKQRHEIKDGMIRAIYGHSTDINPEYQHTTPPFKLYHGTSKEAVSTILHEGLKPMSRLFVHLSADKNMAHTVGKRKEREPAILKVQALEANKAGVRFYHANKDVWLSEFILVKFIEIEVY
jgi:putative RNA 2'-phosphotransferase